METRAIHTIAAEIEKTWQGKVNFAARPYLDAMHSLINVDDSFGLDPARSIIMYFLSNATTWRGDEARRIKKELNGLIK
jgi:hypothetical protein